MFVLEVSASDGYYLTRWSLAVSTNKELLEKIKAELEEKTSKIQADPFKILGYVNIEHDGEVYKVEHLALDEFVDMITEKFGVRVHHDDIIRFTIKPITLIE